MTAKHRISKSLPATTTQQEDVTTAGQRKINLIWEYTQATIAILMTIAFVYCETQKVDSIGVRMGFSLIIGFYFSRTNHAAIGGIGKKPAEAYKGR